MQTISELLRLSLTKYASLTALKDKGSFTYAKLLEYATYLAAALASRGVQQGEPVGIYLNRSKEYITALVACLLYGYEAVLLSTSYPQGRNDYMLQDAGAKAIIDDSFWQQALAAHLTMPQPEVAPETNALVVYTSGSTGKPKGVLHDQSSVYQAVARFMRALDYTEQDLYGSSAPYTFIAVGIDVLYPLCVGAAIQVVPLEVVKNASAFAAYIDEKQITATNIPPKVLKNFHKQGQSLRVATTGSEKVSGIAPTDFRIFNLYGMSEGFPSVSIFEIDKAYDTTPLGKGDGSLGLYVLDENGQEADEGEICVSGHLFSGYLNLPEKTAQVLVPNPFAVRDGYPLLFHTQDMGRRLPDGNLVFLNRKDWMLKINGFRIEPSTVESVIKSMPHIADCVVKGFTRSNGNAYLVAYFVEKAPVAPSEIRGRLFAILPYYMVPAYFVRLSALPVNENGKLDYQALKEPDVAKMALPSGEQTYEITTGTNFAYLDYGEASVIKGQFTFTDPIEPQLLQQAVQEMLLAFPFVAVQKVHTEDKTRYVLAPNRAAFPAVQREIPLMPYDKEANNYLFTISCYNKTLYLNVAHLLTDGFGINVMAHYLVCRYVNLKYDPQPIPADLYNKQFHFDYADPVQFLQPVHEEWRFNYTAKSLFTEDMLDEKHPRHYTLTVPAAQVKHLVNKAEGSASGLWAYLLGKSLLRLVAVPQEMVISSPADMRHVLGCEQTFRNCNTSIKYRLIQGFDKCELVNVLTALRGMLYMQMDPVCCLPKFTRECELVTALKAQPTLAEKERFLQSKLILSPHPIVTDAGYFEFGLWNNKVEDIHFYGNILGGAGIILGYILFRNNYILNITSTLRDESWLTQLCDSLQEIGIEYKVGKA